MLKAFLVATMTVCVLSTGQVSGYPGTGTAALQRFKASVMKEWLHEKKLAGIQEWFNQLAHIQNGDEVCNLKYGKEKINQVLSMYDISWMIDPKKKKTFLYVPEAYTGIPGEERVYKSSGEHGGAAGLDHAEDHMLDEIVKTNNQQPPQEFWITNTPCPVCARTLMAAYSRPSTKATIMAHRLYIPPGPPKDREANRNKALDCLAKMMYQGFTFMGWNWQIFYNNYLKDGNPKCIEKLSKVEESEEKLNALTEQWTEMFKGLFEAEGRSKDPSWTSNVANKCLA